MKNLRDFEDQIHKCSKCGICQGSCPVYKITGNDCSVSRGHFVMLRGFLDGEFKMSKTLNRYFDLCLKCGACAKACPSGINAVDVIVAAKQEYFKHSLFEKFISFLQKAFIFGLFVDFANIFVEKSKSKKFEKKVLYFGGCRSKLSSDRALVSVMNSIGVEVINPNFACCGIPLFMRGDLESFQEYINNYINILKKYGINEVVTTCASCEKTLKDYAKWADDVESKSYLSSIKVRNVYEYIRENELFLKLKEPCSVTYHKPCNIENFSDIEWILKNTENLNYVEMLDYDKCCGLNGISKFKEYRIMKQIFNSKRNNIINTKVKSVLTSCLGCEVALKFYSLGAYKTYDMLEFLAKRLWSK